MSLATAFLWKLGRQESCFQRLGGLRGLFGGSKASDGGGKERKKRAKLRIDNLADMNELRRTGAKQFQAAEDVSPVEDSPFFPTLSGTTLSGHSVTLPDSLAGSVALLTVSMRAYGMRHCEQYSKPYMDSLGSHPETTVFELSLIDVWIYRILARWMTRNLTKSMSHDKHDHFMIYTGRDVVGIRETLQLTNSIVGYVFLLDREGRIRWRAHASPSKQEISALLNCTNHLLETRSK